MKRALQIGLILGAFLCCVKAYTMPIVPPIDQRIPMMLSYISSLEARNAKLEKVVADEQEWYESMERYNTQIRDWRNGLTRRLKILEAEVLG